MVNDAITGSEEFYRLFDLAPEAIARFSQFVERLHPEDRERVQQDVADALQHGRPYDTDYRVKLSDGGWRKVPLGAGLNMVQSKLGEVPFLPVLTKGDLREQSPSNPVLHLHRILLHKLDQRSAMEVRGIRRVIQDNLAEHFGYIPVGSKSVAMGGTPTMQRSAIA